MALGLAASDLQLQQLAHFLELLQRWNSVYNLTSVRDPHAMRVLHLADCMAAVPALRRHSPHAARVLDVGSGGGLPGVVLAILCPHWHVDCVDTVAKKSAFVRQVAAEVGLPNLHGRHLRVEHWPDGPVCDLVVCRAFASLPDFVRLSRRTLSERGVWVAMKGPQATQEAATLRDTTPGVHVFHVEPLSVPGLDAQRSLVWMRPTPGSG